MVVLLPDVPTHLLTATVSPRMRQTKIDAFLVQMLIQALRGRVLRPCSFDVLCYPQQKNGGA